MSGAAAIAATPRFEMGALMAVILTHPNTPKTYTPHQTCTLLSFPLGSFFFPTRTYAREILSLPNPLPNFPTLPFPPISSYFSPSETRHQEQHLAGLHWRQQPPLVSEIEVQLKATQKVDNIEPTPRQACYSRSSTDRLMPIVFDLPLSLLPHCAA